MVPSASVSYSVSIELCEPQAYGSSGPDDPGTVFIIPVAVTTQGVPEAAIAAQVIPSTTWSRANT